MESKQSNFNVRLSSSEKILFDKIQNGNEDDHSELERKPKKYHKQDIHPFPL